MADRLVLHAGTAAREYIRQHGLQPAHVRAVVGASGAAKWLGICGLDQAVFGDWLPRDGAQPIDLLGTSIGTFKLAAACQDDPRQSLATLAEAYIAQRYHGVPTPESISRETARIVSVALPDGGSSILSHPRYRFHVGTARCHGGLADPRPGGQKRAIVAGFFANLRGRARLHHWAERVVFSDPRSAWPLAPVDGVPSQQVALCNENLGDAVVASGALPVYMQGVHDIRGAPTGVYRDGGLLDYHPVPDWLFAANAREGVVLYPHFFAHVSPGWFDKALRWRRARAQDLRNVLLISPSAAHVERLPGGRLPDRRDFSRCADADRQARWRAALAESQALGEAFLALVDKPERLVAQVLPIPA
ncbi:MAG: patatin-like phospholipase family protein [Pseudomonadota bacterium]